MTAGVAMTNYGMKEEYVQANIYTWRTRSFVVSKIKKRPRAAPSSEN